MKNANTTLGAKSQSQWTPDSHMSLNYCHMSTNDERVSDNVGPQMIRVSPVCPSVLIDECRVESAFSQISQSLKKELGRFSIVFALSYSFQPWLC